MALPWRLQVTEMAVSELPGNPNAVWTVKTNVSGTLCAPTVHFSLTTIRASCELDTTTAVCL